MSSNKEDKRKGQDKKEKQQGKEGWAGGHGK